ncbi:DNA-binding domain-containing protein [Paraburkholderia sp. Cpub6]|uniref:HvfC/BufC N-terminal domain-containing protein n=1 Tax=Paraburkholderia sp. Cpub6 TaxID=2723094 RepID=UPI0016106549|nr:DNA-binding domain-containing protein [Paraburkholderia sp. Cpub6]MBB5460169.1 hypothetical protein [Paraburkholderia sp. Cpub6]
MDKTLEDVQLDFATALLNVNAEQRLLQVLVGDEAKNRKRVALYRDNLRQMWHRVLASAYPVLRELLGDDFFLSLSREYGAADPAWSGDLNRFGSRMAELLEAWPPTATYRYLADVARLEWLVHRAYFAADAVTLTADGQARCTRETLENSSLRLHPAVELLHTSTSAADLWLSAHDSGQNLEPRDYERPQWMVVVRPRWIPDVMVISPTAFAMLHDLRDGAAMGDALDAALVRDSNFDFERDWQAWINHGIVVTG